MDGRPLAPAFRPAPKDTISQADSAEPPPIFDDRDDQTVEHHDLFTEPTTAFGSGLEEQGSYDLKPPPPSVSHGNLEALSHRFFSVDHLNTILKDPALSSRFSKFLHQYRAQHIPKLNEYFSAKKAQTAVEYANAVANQLPTEADHPPYIAAVLNERFKSRMQENVEELVEDALPAYVTHRLTQLVTESLVKEITGNSAPVMRELLPSLAEVYCITDPSLPDNPIVYASEEFYNISQYGREYVIGRNCRFLQGPRTSNASVRRLIDALAAGQEITETILNYRRDGSPFMNLLLIAPLYDNKGHVRYFLGCQIDVSSLIEGGRGLESFANLLAKDRTDSKYGDSLERDPKRVLGEFGACLNEEESNIVKTRTRSFSEDGLIRSGTAMSGSTRAPRRRLGMDEIASPSDRQLWPHPSLGPSGRLPGVYQNYLLVRPYPSLRITFTSPALRIPGLLQTKFLDRIGGPENVREGLLDSLAHGTGVTAKITWLSSHADEAGNRTSTVGRPRWIHCTPLLGSDEKVGVWMVVMVDGEEITGGLRRGEGGGFDGGGGVFGASFGGASGGGGGFGGAGAGGAGGGADFRGSTVMSSPGSRRGAASPRFTGSKLYAEYVRREGRGVGGVDGDVEGGDGRFSEEARERREVDRNFRDF